MGSEGADRKETSLEDSGGTNSNLIFVGLSMGGLVNALWDLRGRIEKKPVWKILVEPAVI